MQNLRRCVQASASFLDQRVFDEAEYLLFGVQVLGRPPRDFWEGVRLTKKPAFPNGYGVLAIDTREWAC